MWGTNLGSAFYIPNFFLDRPFEFSVHQDTLFCPGLLFKFSTYHVYSIFIYIPDFLPEPFWFAGMPLFFPRPVNLAGLYLCVVSFHYVHIDRVRKIVTIHGGQNHGSTRKYTFDDKWPFVRGSPFSPEITLWQYDVFDH